MPYAFQVTRTFSFTEDYEIKWHGTGGRTVLKARAFDPGVVDSFRRDTVILQLGSDNFVHGDPLSIASAIVELLTLLHNSFLVKQICVCQTLYRVSSPAFNQRVRNLVKYLKDKRVTENHYTEWRHSKRLTRIKPLKNDPISKINHKITNDKSTTCFFSSYVWVLQFVAQPSLNSTLIYCGFYHVRFP